MTSSDSQIDKPQRGCPKRAELLVVNTCKALILRELLQEQNQSTLDDVTRLTLVEC